MVECIFTGMKATSKSLQNFDGIEIKSEGCGPSGIPQKKWTLLSSDWV